MKKQNAEDIGEVLQKVEKSFRFQFGKTELKEVKTFGDLCDIITSKVQGDNSDDCTTQQAFYKLRNAIATILFIDTNSLTVGTNLHELFPRQQRRRQIKELEKALHIQTKALRPKNWITITFVLLLIASFIGLFIFWKVGLVGLVFSFAGLKISDWLGKELNVTTVGDLAEKFSREHYKFMRRNPATANRKEVAQKVKELFIIDLDLEAEALTRETTFK